MGKNISLVGFMGSGKTTVARLLAKKLNRKLVSTDDAIVQKERRPITEIFSVKGESHFRSLEREVVAQLAQEKSLIIDCGGGIVLQEENIANLKKNGVIIYLKATVDVLHERTKKDSHRPLLNVDDPKVTIKGLLLKREPFYDRADHTVDTSAKTVDEVVNEVIDLVSHG